MKRRKRKYDRQLLAHPIQQLSREQENTYNRQVRESTYNRKSEKEHDKQSQHNHSQFLYEDNWKATSDHNNIKVHECRSSVSHQLRALNTIHSKKQELQRRELFQLDPSTLTIHLYRVPSERHRENKEYQLQ